VIKRLMTFVLNHPQYNLSSRVTDEDDIPETNIIFWKIVHSVVWLQFNDVSEIHADSVFRTEVQVNQVKLTIKVQKPVQRVTCKHKVVFRIQHLFDCTVN
jgi:hypothetical protein